MKEDIAEYNEELAETDRQICDALYQIIEVHLPKSECKVWHGHPVWFLDGNPIVGYSKLKGDVQLLFWSGQSFDEPKLSPEGNFKAAEIRFASPGQVKVDELRRFLHKAAHIQWDYKNIVKNRGILHKLG